jgi:hypothetical protein
MLRHIGGGAKGFSAVVPMPSLEEFTAKSIGLVRQEGRPGNEDESS